MKLPRLKPCPFCGHPAEFLEPDLGWFGIACLRHTRINLFVRAKRKSLAIKIWNTRAKAKLKGTK